MGDHPHGAIHYRQCFEEMVIDNLENYTRRYEDSIIFREFLREIMKKEMPLENLVEWVFGELKYPYCMYLLSVQSELLT